MRLGELILNAASEPYPVVEAGVIAIRPHPQYNPVNLQNDIAVLKLAFSINFTASPQIIPVCLPPAGAIYTAQRFACRTFS